MIAAAWQVKTAAEMADRAPPPLSEQFTAVVDWWRDAGVDCDFADDVTDWLAPAKMPETRGEVAAVPTPAPAPPRPLVPGAGPAHKVDADRSVWPTELGALRDWWTSSYALDAGGAYPRIPPMGPAQAKMMIVVNQPEASDGERLLGGPEGALLDGFLRAAGYDRDAVYLASLLPRHDPAPDWPAIREAGLGDLLAHHVGLVSPKRILFLGRNIPPLLGHDMAQGPAVLRDFNHDSLKIPAMGASGLADMLRSAKRRERFWRCWLDWTYGETKPH